MEPYLKEWYRNHAIIKLADDMHIGVKMTYGFLPHPTVILTHATSISDLKAKIDKSVEEEQLKIRLVKR